ncbi:hypothetical protein A6A27_32090 [Micromonospora sp. CB01531]|nr:hypothetical protein A6A27_32090 [Micromonospora sp. CB01531]
MPLGIFRLEVTDWQETAAIPTAQLYDRSKGLSTTGIRGFVSRSGWMASAVIVEFLNWYYPYLNATYASVFEEGVTDYRIPGGHTFGQTSYWDAISELAKNMGGRLYFDVNGSPKVSPVVELTSVVGTVLDLAAGEGGVLVDAGHSYSREGIYNGVTVIGATTPEGGIVEASLYNSDPSSPLRYGGPFGKAVNVIEDTTLTTEAQCYQRARAELARHTGLGYSLDFTAIPNPALDAGDFVRFVYADGRVEVHQIDSLSIPLGPGQFTGSSKGLILGA